MIVIYVIAAVVAAFIFNKIFNSSKSEGEYDKGYNNKGYRNAEPIKDSNAEERNASSYESNPNRSQQTADFDFIPNKSQVSEAEIKDDTERLATIDGLIYKLGREYADIIGSEGTLPAILNIPESITNKGVSYFVSTIYEDSIKSSDVIKIIIPKSVEEIEFGAFSLCDKLEEFEVVQGNEYSTIDGILMYENSILAFPRNKKFDGIPAEVTDIYDYSFEYCNTIVNLEIPNTIEDIWESTFKGCENLETVIIPDSIVDIRENVFSDCPKLKSVTLGNSVNTIQSEAFSNCVSLTDIKIPQSVTVIYENAFAGCSNLDKAMVPENCEIDKKAFPRWTTIIRY